MVKMSMKGKVKVPRASLMGTFTLDVQSQLAWVLLPSGG